MSLPVGKPSHVLVPNNKTHPHTTERYTGDLKGELFQDLYDGDEEASRFDAGLELVPTSPDLLYQWLKVSTELAETSRTRSAYKSVVYLAKPERPVVVRIRAVVASVKLEPERYGADLP